MKILTTILISLLLLTFSCASPIPEDEEDSQAKYKEMMYQSAVESKQLLVSDPSLSNFNLDTAANSFQNFTANLTALIQYLVQLEVNKTIAALTAVQNFTGISKQNEIKQVDQTVEFNKPLFYVRRRPDFYPGPHHPAYFYNPFIPYLVPNAYMYHGNPISEFRRPINPTNDDSLTDAEALEQLEYLFNEKSVQQDPEARGLLSSLSASSNAAKNSFKSFFSSLSGQISVVTKTLLVPSLAVSG